MLCRSGMRTSMSISLSASDGLVRAVEEVVDADLALTGRAADHAHRVEHRRTPWSGPRRDRPGTAIRRAVPRLRTTGSAITRSASRKIGHTAASVVATPAPRGAASSRRSAPASARRRRSPSSAARSLMSTRYSGLAMRSFIIGSRLCPPATINAPVPQPVQQSDRVVDAGRAFVFEGSRYLHVTDLTSLGWAPSVGRVAGPSIAS